jgi:glycosyltransferase involved in cell wall biosynthesis
MPEPGVSIIIPVRNDERRLANCLASLRACDYPREQVEIIVADNGSTDGSAQVARDAGATVLSLPGLAVAQVRNRAAQSASRELLAFVDADHEVSPEWLRSAAETLSDSRVAAAGNAYLTPPGGTWVQRIYDSFRDHREGRFDTLWLGSGNLAVRRSVFLELGGFDETLETCEDVDLCRRIRRHDWRLMSDSGMRSVHLGDPKTLRALFLGELWRGRDNLRVSLRPPIVMSELPSIVIPIFQLMLMAVLPVALVDLIFGLGLLPIPFVASEDKRRVGGVVALGAVAVFAALAALRAGRMVGRLSPRRSGDVPRAFAVAVVYDLARALALVLRASHGVRRKAA